MTPLRSCLEGLIGKSTAASTSHDDLRAAVVLAETLAGSAQAARHVRTERIVAAVRAYGAVIPADYAMSVRARTVAYRIGNHLVEHDLRKVPSGRVIRRELRRMDAERESQSFRPEQQAGRCPIAHQQPRSDDSGRSEGEGAAEV